MALNVRISGLDELDKIAETAEAEIKQRLHEAGQNAVRDAIATGDYHDVTGRLRSSNHYELTNKGLVIYNSAPYADEVEARGHNVITSAALRALSALEKQ